jgi:GTPase SAR1 family protein
MILNDTTTNLGQLSSLSEAYTCENRRVKLHFRVVIIDDIPNIKSQWLRHVHGVVLIYSTTSISSFSRIRGLYDQIQKHFSGRSVHFLLLGNKHDKRGEREVDFHRGFALSRNMDCDFHEISAEGATWTRWIFLKTLTELHWDYQQEHIHHFKDMCLHHSELRGVEKTEYKLFKGFRYLLNKAVSPLR